MNARFSAQDQKFDQRFDAIDRHFDAMNRRFDEMRDFWRSELHRFEEVLDARLKHLEER
jgi:hypothetical protein